LRSCGGSWLEPAQRFVGGPGRLTLSLAADKKRVRRMDREYKLVIKEQSKTNDQDVYSVSAENSVEHWQWVATCRDQETADLLVAALQAKAVQP
jgi:hypothetical protein